MARAALYPTIDPDKGYLDPKKVIESSHKNCRNHADVDAVKEKCLRFTQGKHFDEDTEADRTSQGLPSVVADETLPVFKTLDGYARKSRINVDFQPLGNDDYEGAKLRTTVFSSARSATGLSMRQAEAYGMAAIVGEAYLYVYPETNVLGELEPCLYVPMAFEGYPDGNCKDPIWMQDARFFDFRTYRSVESILETMGDFLEDEHKKLLSEWSEGAANEDKSNVREQSTDRTGATQDSRDGMPLVIHRFYRVNRKSALYLVDENTGEDRRVEADELAEGGDPFLAALHKDPAMAKEMGVRFDKQDEEWIWNCILIPAVSDEVFFLNAPCDFQPVDPRTRKKRFPVIRLPHLYVGGKIMGAIQTIVKLQEYRNLLLSAFVHHVQTTANGALGYEAGAFKDDDNKNKFKTRRNRANETIEFAPMGPDKRSAKDKVFVLPKGEWAFQDGGAVIEDIFKDLVQKLTGATQIIRGDAQQGSPASLYKQQTEQADNNMQGTTDLYKEFQYAAADLFNNFVQQFYTEERILEIEGPSGDPTQMILNQRTAFGIVNDVTQGLYGVRKTDAAPTESARRQRLSDNLEIVKALVESQLPAILVDFESVIENLDIPEARKQRYLTGLDQWRVAQGIQLNAQAMTAQAGVQQAQAGAAEAGAKTAVNQELMRMAGPGQSPAPMPQQAVPAGSGY